MPTIPDSKRFFTVSEYAAITGDSESTIRREIRAGNLPYHQSGPRKKIKIPFEALEVQSCRTAEAISAKNERKTPDDLPESFSGPEPKWID